MTVEDVTVGVESTDEPPAVIEDAPDVVVVDTGSDSGDSLEIGTALGALSVTVGALVETVNSLAARLDQAESSASAAIDIAVDAAITADEALTEAEEVLQEAEETAEDAKDDLIEPDREHWLWKKRGGLKAEVA